MSCDEGRRCGSDLALLWLWCRLAATAPIRPLTWETPYTMSVALKKKKKKKKKDNSMLWVTFVSIYAFLYFHTVI